MKRGFFKVGGSRHKLLIPSDARAESALDGCKIGDVVRVQISKPRHPGHHKKYWTMISLVHEASNVSDLYATPQHLHDAIKGALGYWSEIRLPDGSVYKKVDSTAFESMSQGEFQEFYDKAVDVIVTQIVPALDREDLEREVMELVK